MAGNSRGRAAGKTTGVPRRRATKVPAVAQVELVDGAGRLLLTLLGNYLHRLDVERRRIYYNDLDLARIIEIIGLRGVEAGMRDAAYRDRYRDYDRPVDIQDMRSATASSIASATGFPRETVRRKIRKLIELGLIVETSRSNYVLNPGIYLREEAQLAMARGFHATVLFINEALAQGLIRWVPAPEKKKRSSQ